ncbi:MAG: DUF5317 domain-containing protein [Actinobacteria bacterium]|nr:DUF5317 domain-containing protein [Actinomycetota bacterium]
MPLTVLIVGAAVVLSLLRGGRFGRIAEADLRLTWLLFVGLALQLGVDAAAARGHLEGNDGYVLLLLSQLLVVGWTLANWWRPGMLLIFLGLALNAAVMAANGAMPVAPEAIEAIGLEGAEVPPGKHELMTEDTRLAVLADTWPLPPIRTIISIGDIVLAAGLIPLVHHLMTYRTPAERRGGPRVR